MPRMLKLARVERGGGHADFGSDIHLRVWGRVGFEDRGEIKSFQDSRIPFENWNSSDNFDISIFLRERTFFPPKIILFLFS